MVNPVNYGRGELGYVILADENGLPYKAGASGGGGTGEVEVTSSALPDGAATQVTLEALRALVAGGANVTISNASIPVTDNGGSLTVDGSVGVTGSVTVATHAVTQSGTWTVTSSGNNSATAPALTVYRNVALSSTAVQVKSGAARLYSYSVFNGGSAITYLHFWNALSANVTVGTTVPLITVGIPAGSMWDGFWSMSPTFSTGLTIAATINPDGTGGAPVTALGVGYLGFV